MPVQRIKTLLTKRIWLNPKTVALTLKLSEPVSFKPGQYLNLHVGNAWRAYSITNTGLDFHQEIDLCIDTDPGGPGSQFAAFSVLGTETEALAPLGVFTVEDSQSPALFIATGSGIAPFRPMIESLLRKQTKPIPVNLLWGMPHHSMLYWTEEWEVLQKKFPQFTATYCLSRDGEETPFSKNTFSGRVNAYVPTLPSLATITAYVCGSADMVKDVTRTLLQNGVKSDKIKREQYH